MNKMYIEKEWRLLLIYLIIFLFVIIGYGTLVFISVILIFALLEPLVTENFIEFPGVIVLVVSIILMFIFSLVKPIIKTERVWFLNTIFIMIFILIIGFIIISSIPSINFYTNLAILLSIIIFSIPVGMINLKNLYDIKLEKK